jgi:putative IMPACT (imprinted ancient) family translation regulator
MEETLRMSKTDRLKASKILFYTSEIISQSNSHFQLYSTEVCTVHEAKMAYRAISLDPTAASSTHLISAYWLETDEQGYVDDHDHGMGKHLLGIMQDAEMTNSICFLRREYGGIHLGFRRYEIVSELVDNIYAKVQQQFKPRCLNVYQKNDTAQIVDIYSEVNDLSRHIENTSIQLRKQYQQNPSEPILLQEDNNHTTLSNTAQEAKHPNAITSTPKSVAASQTNIRTISDNEESLASEQDENPYTTIPERRYKKGRSRSHPAARSRACTGQGPSSPGACAPERGQSWRRDRTV